MNPKETMIAQLLVDSGLLSELGDTVVHGIAKLFQTSAIGPLTVWPTTIALNEVTNPLSKEKCSLLQHPGDLMFDMSVTSGNNLKIKLGSINCARSTCAGGPCISRDSELLPETSLRQLWYLGQQFEC